VVSASQDELRLTLANDLAELARVNEAAGSFLARRAVGERTGYATRLALEELLSNVIRHGYDEGEEDEISVRLQICEEGVELEVVDGGREFDPLSVRPIDVHAPLERRMVGGLGIHLLRSLVSEIRYQRAEGKNHVRVRI
jgi:serine/threonine-protein kinase RsbW